MAEAENLRVEIRAALNAARVIDPDDGTVPFHKGDEYRVWTSPDLLIDTLIARVVGPITAERDELRSLLDTTTRPEEAA